MASAEVFTAPPPPPPPRMSSPEALPEAGISSSSDWYPSTSVQYQGSYITPYNTAPLESQQWNNFDKTSMAPLSMTPYALAPPLPNHHYFMAPNRPRSSPSTFGPSPESINWPTSSGLGIQYNHEPMGPPSTIPSNSYEPFPSVEAYSAPGTPELRAPVPRRPYQSIAPSPAGVAAASKRRRDTVESDREDSVGPGKRRRRTASVNSADLSEDDRYLVKLKEDESLPWKEIATRFQSEKGKSFQVAALQMRYKRLREKFRVWEDRDLNALKLAHEYWGKYKWEIISQKMTEFGDAERWPARSCARKWQDLEMMAATSMASVPSTIAPNLTRYTSSPVEGPPQYAFVPM